MADEGKELADKLAKMEKDMEELQRKNQEQADRIIGLMAQPAPHTYTAPKAQPQLPQEPKLDLSGMPDQLTKPEEYTKELERRNTDYYKRMRAYERDLEKAEAAAEEAAEPQGPNTDALWSMYTEDHADYAKDVDGVKFAAGVVMERMVKRGQNPDALMQRSPEDFFKKVNEVYDKRFGAPGEDKGDEPSDDPADDRTAGLFGGQESGGKPGKGKDAEPTSTFSDELKKAQDAMWKDAST